VNSSALSEYFITASEHPAELGRLDCVRFVVEALNAGWGIDYTAMLGYGDRRTAIDRLRLAGGLEAAFTAELGDPIYPALLEPGDFAFFPDPAVGLVMPGYCAVKVRKTIIRVPLQFIEKGWRAWVR
jgi:hypothetical protein